MKDITLEDVTRSVSELEDLILELELSGRNPDLRINETIDELSLTVSGFVEAYLNGFDLPISGVYRNEELYELVNTLYLYGEKIGEGAYGVVVKIIDPETGKRFVIKRVPVSGANRCTLEGATYRRCDDNSIQNVPPGVAYVCEGSMYTEFLISALLNRARTLATTFITTCGIAGSLENQELYMMMEAIETTIPKIIKYYEKSSASYSYIDDLLDNWLVQILQGIYILQLLHINHNDLHINNILLDLQPQQADYIKLYVHDRELYVKDIGMYPKIIDFGMAIKYQGPGIISDTAASKVKCTSPNWFSHMFDAVSVIGSFAKAGHQMSILILEYIGFKDNMWSTRYGRPAYFIYDDQGIPIEDSKGNKYPTGFLELDRRWTVTELFSLPPFQRFYTKPEGKIIFPAALID